MTGTGGSVKVDGVEVARVRNWSLTRTGNVQTYSDSSTPGQMKREAGVKDWTATCQVYVEDNVAGSGGGEFPFEEGDSVSLELNVSSTVKWTGDAVVEEIAGPEVDIEGGSIVGATITFGANGALTPPSGQS